MPSAPRNDVELDRRCYLAAVLFLTLLCLWPIWALDFPPLQDYPQHLFLAHVNATYDSPAWNWSHYYLTELKPGPYALFYLVVVLLERLMPVTVAGKVVLSLYIGMLAGLTLVALKSTRHGSPPWGALLIFPLAFHQMYFMGFTNFLLSLPLLALAVLDHQRFAAARQPVSAYLRQAGLVVLLLFCHPYTVLVYIALTGATAILPGPDGVRRKAAWIPPAVIAACFAAWYFTSLPANRGKMPLLWWPWQETLRYFLLMFTGMRWGNGIHWPTLATWTAALPLLAYGVRQSLRAKVPFPRRTGLALVLSLAGFFVLPFWAGQYSYFNLRMAPVVYLFAALLAGYATLSRRAGLGLVAIAGLLIGQSAFMQTAIAEETAEIQPLIAKMAANATLLPITFQTDSAVLDRHFFPEAHSHDYFYYHLLVGGGASPSLFPSPMLPVRFKPGVNLPLATHGFSWQEQGSHYDYIITRGAPTEFAPFVTRYATLVTKSGAWLLFRNDHH